MLTWLICQSLAVIMLRLGFKHIHHNFLSKVGKLAHQQKMKALVKYWPLNQIIPALHRNKKGLCQLILTVLIALKSLMCFVFGPVMLLWLPLAAYAVPAIISAHRTENKKLTEWVSRISIWQVTSHSLAATAGTLLIFAWWNDNTDIIVGDMTFIMTMIVFISASIISAFVAGKLEAKMLMYLYAMNFLGELKKAD